MRERKPVYVLAPGGRDLLPPGFVPGHDPIPIADPEQLRDRVPGVLLLPVRGLDPTQLLAALLIAAAAPPDSPWMPALVEAGDDGVSRARPISLGWPVPGTELGRWAEGEPAQLLELRYVLARVARSRHDLNNPLTSAMAETQLAQMDATDEQTRAGLETVAQQLRRLRDMIAALKARRPPH